MFLGKESPCIFSTLNPLKTDTPLKQTLSMAPSSESLLTVFDCTTTIRSPNRASGLVSFLFNLHSRNLALRCRLCPHVSGYFLSVLQQPPFSSVHTKTISRRFQKSPQGTVFENLRFRCSKKPFTFGRKAKTEEKSPDTYRHCLRLNKVRLPKYRLIFRCSGNISSQYKIVLVSFPKEFQQNFWWGSFWDRRCFQMDWVEYKWRT